MLVFPLGPAHSTLVADRIQFLCNDLNRRGVGCTWSQILDRCFAQPEPWKQGEGARWRTNLTVTDTLNPNGGVVSLELAWSPRKYRLSMQNPSHGSNHLLLFSTHVTLCSEAGLHRELWPQSRVCSSGGIRSDNPYSSFSWVSIYPPLGVLVCLIRNSNCPT